MSGCQLFIRNIRAITDYAESKLARLVRREESSFSTCARDIQTPKCRGTQVAERGGDGKFVCGGREPASVHQEWALFLELTEVPPGGFVLAITFAEAPKPYIQANKAAHTGTHVSVKFHHERIFRICTLEALGFGTPQTQS